MSSSHTRTPWVRFPHSRLAYRLHSPGVLCFRRPVSPARQCTRKSSGLQGPEAAPPCTGRTLPAPTLLFPANNIPIGLPIAAVPGVRASGRPRPATARQRCQAAHAGAGAAILTRCGIRPAERSLRDSGPLQGSRRSPGLESSHEKDDDVEAQAQGSLHRRRVVHGRSRGGAHHPGDRDRGQQRPRRVTPPDPHATLGP